MHACVRARAFLHARAPGHVRAMAVSGLPGSMPRSLNNHLTRVVEARRSRKKMFSCHERGGGGGGAQTIRNNLLSVYSDFLHSCEGGRVLNDATPRRRS